MIQPHAADAGAGGRGARDFRAGIDGLAARCRTVLEVDPFSGTVFVFATVADRDQVLVYDGQGFWLCHKRFSASRLSYWRARREVEVHEWR